METIKIEIGVKLDLSDSVKQFFTNLFLNKNCKCEAPKIEECITAPATIEAPKTEAPKAEAPKAEAPKAEAPKAEAPKAEAPATIEEPKAEVPATQPDITIEMVRLELSKKVNEHRGTIKEKLTELGAPSVTKLDPLKYEEMFNFLKAL